MPAPTRRLSHPPDGEPVWVGHYRGPYQLRPRRRPSGTLGREATIGLGMEVIIPAASRDKNCTRCEFCRRFWGGYIFLKRSWKTAPCGTTLLLAVRCLEEERSE